MTVSLFIVAVTVALMGAVAWRAHATLPAGPLPMGRTNKPNANRFLVVLQAPLIYLAALAVILAKDNVLDTGALLFASAVMLVGQQAQLWGVRRIMRKHPL